MLDPRNPPESATRAAQDGIRRFLRLPHNSASTLAMVTESGVRLVAPHRVYNVGLAELADGYVTQAARFTGWRFILLRQDQPIATVEVNPRSDGAFRFGALTEGPIVDATVKAIAAAEQLPDLRAEHEVLFLRVPALHVSTLWLHAPGSDRFIPLPSSASSLQPFAPCDESDVQAVLQPLAQRRIATEQAEDDAAATSPVTFSPIPSKLPPPAAPAPANVPPVARGTPDEVANPAPSRGPISRPEPQRDLEMPPSMRRIKRWQTVLQAATVALTLVTGVVANSLASARNENARLRESLRLLQAGPDEPALTETQLVTRYLSVLTGGDERSKAGAIRSISDRSPRLAAAVTALKPSLGTVSGLRDVRSSARISQLERSSIDSTLANLPAPLKSVGPDISPAPRTDSVVTRPAPDTSRIGMVGYWEDPYGNVWAGGRCTQRPCARIVLVSDSARSTSGRRYGGLWRDTNGNLWVGGECGPGQACAYIDIGAEPEQ